MEYDPNNPNSQDQLTKICQVIANPNSRRLLEILAESPMALSDLEERIDLPSHRVTAAAEMMISLQLVQKLDERRSSTGAMVRSATYKLADEGFLLLRSWLDRLSATSTAEE